MLLIVSHTNLPSKTLEGLVFIFVALLIEPPQGAALKEMLLF